MPASSTCTLSVWIRISLGTRFQRSRRPRTTTTSTSFRASSGTSIKPQTTAALPGAFPCAPPGASEKGIWPMERVQPTAEERKGRGRAIGSRAACGPVVEAVSRTCPRVGTVGPMATPQSAIVEPLEGRVLLSATFNAYVSCVASQSQANAVTVYLWTTGGQASKWDIKWNDNSPDTVLNASDPQYGGTFPVPVTAQHNYAAQTQTITATATPAAGGNPVTATFALNSGFGYTNGDSTKQNHQGETTYTPSGATGNASGKAMAIDPNTGKIYVLSLDNSYAAVTRFTSAGAVDSSFNPSGTAPGTIQLTTLGTGVPTSIAVSSDGTYVAVGGNFGSGWGVA